MKKGLWKRACGWVNRLNQSGWLARPCGDGNLVRLPDGSKSGAIYDVTKAGWRRVA
jgi:hypothetical protein